MAVGQFRHANSAEEIQKREAREATGVSEAVKGFRHYNHPEEVAKRERKDPPPGPLEQQRGAAPAMVPAVMANSVIPSSVSRDLFPAPQPAVVVPPGPTSAVQRLFALERLVAEFQGRVTELENLLETRVDKALADLFGTPEELQALRVAMANQAQVERTTLENVNRIRALEQTLDGLGVVQADDATDTDAPTAQG